MITIVPVNFIYVQSPKSGLFSVEIKINYKCDIEIYNEVFNKIDIIYNLCLFSSKWLFVNKTFHNFTKDLLSKAKLCINPYNISPWHCKCKYCFNNVVNGNYNINNDIVREKLYDENQIGNRMISNHKNIIKHIDNLIKHYCTINISNQKDRLYVLYKLYCFVVRNWNNIKKIGNLGNTFLSKLYEIRLYHDKNGDYELIYIFTTEFIKILTTNTTLSE